MDGGWDRERYGEFNPSQRISNKAPVTENKAIKGPLFDFRFGGPSAVQGPPWTRCPAGHADSFHFLWLWKRSGLKSE